MKTIPLTRGLVAYVDDGDYEAMSAYKWYAHWCPFTKSFYARCGITIDGKTRQFLMHRMILELPKAKPGVDHINRNTLDNQRANLRLANHSENAGNTKKRSDNKSGYKGVCWHKAACRWIAQIQKNNKTIYLGLYSTPEEAHAAYRKAAEQLHGEFARLS